MTHAEAGRIRACINCASPGGWLCKTTKGENPGRLLRLCGACLRGGDWYRFGLVDREPLLIEVPTEYVEGEWRFPEADGAEPSAVISYTAEPIPETGHIGWVWWALGRMGDAPTYDEARRMAEEVVQRVIDGRVAVL